MTKLMACLTNGTSIREENLLEYKTAKGLYNRLQKIIPTWIKNIDDKLIPSSFNTVRIYSYVNIYDDSTFKVIDEFPLNNKSSKLLI